MTDYDNQCGLWKKDGKNGPYYSGKITVGGIEYWANLYKNDRKQSDKAPDLNLKLKPVEDASGRQRPAAQRQATTSGDFQDDDIPF